MKRIFTTLLCAIAFSSIYAQDYKIGYVETEGILNELPEIKEIESELKTEEAQWTKKLENMEAEITRLQRELENPMITPESRSNKQQSLQLTYTQYQNQTRQAQLDLQEKGANMLAPIEQKIEAAIAKVAEEKGYTYILNADLSGLRTIAYAKNPEDNITDAVVAYLKELQAKEQTATTGSTTIMKQ